MTSTEVSPPTNAAPAWRRVAAQARFETRAILTHGEQVLLAVVIPVLALVALTRTHAVNLDTGGAARIDVVAPGVLALAVMSTAFTSQAIATAFDRRSGVLRLLATTPLGRGGLLAGKVAGVLVVQVVQVTVLSAVAIGLGWHPDPAGIPGALVATVLGTAAFTALALLMAGTLRAEAVLALANLVLLVLVVGGAVLTPASQLPAGMREIAPLLPSGALGEALRGALADGSVPVAPLLVLALWAVLIGAAARRYFRWQ